MYAFEAVLSAVISAISLLFLAFALYYEVSHPGRFKQLKKWLLGSLFTSAGISILSMNLVVKESSSSLILIFIGYFAIIIGTFLMTRIFFQSRQLKIGEYGLALFTIVVLVLMVIYGVVLKNTKIYSLIVIVSFLLMSLIQVAILNIKTSPKIRSDWFRFSTINLTTLVITIFFIVDKIVIRDSPMDLLNRTNMSLITTFLIVHVLNTVGLLLVLIKVFDRSEVFVHTEGDIRDILNYSSSINLILDFDTKEIVRSNNVYLEKFNITDENKEFKYFSKLFMYKKDYQSLISTIKLRPADTVEHQVLLVRNELPPISAIITIRIVTIKMKTYYLVNIFDITTIIDSKNKYEYLASFDELTKLPNRRKLKEEFNYRIKKGVHFNVAILDIDNFKMINDTYGHIIGDMVLGAFGEKLNDFNLGSNIASRYGGDEFVFIFEYMNEKKIESYTNRIIQSLNEPIIIDEITVKPSVSLGMSSYPFDGDNFNTLIEKADQALYESKKNKDSKLVRYFRDL